MNATTPMTKIDALIEAHRVANKTGYAFAVETVEGWVVTLIKPMLRAGKVIECRNDGKEYCA